MSIKTNERRRPAAASGSSAPTGRKVRFSGIEINRMVDGQVAEHWFQLDAVTLFEQLGLHIVRGPRSLPRLLASPVTRLLGKRRRTIPS